MDWDEKALREKLADLAHRQWSGWMAYMFSKGVRDPDGGWVMPNWAVERWQRQMGTDYADLPADEMESDRKEADKFLEVFKPFLRDAYNKGLEDAAVALDGASAPHGEWGDGWRSCRDGFSDAIRALKETT